MIEKETINLGPVEWDEILESIPENMKNMYKELPYIGWEEAKAKYKNNLDWKDASIVIQCYIDIMLANYTEKDLTEKNFCIEIPESFVPSMSYINQLNLTFRKGDSIFAVILNRYRILTIHYLGNAYNDSLTWFYDIKNILCTKGVVKDKNYCKFWGISSDYSEFDESEE